MEKKCKLFVAHTNDDYEIFYKNSSFNLVVAKKKHGHHWHFFFFLIGGNFVNIFFAESTSSNLFSSYTHDVCEDLYKDS